MPKTTGKHSKKAGLPPGTLVHVGELFKEVRSQVRTLSSLEGLRQMVSFTFSIVRNLAVKVAGNNNTKSD